LAVLVPALLVPLNLPAAASREDPSAAAISLCVITPRITEPTARIPAAVVAISRPTVFVIEPLIEMQILEGSRLRWQRRAGDVSPSPAGGSAISSLPTATLEGPIPWPLPALRPGQILTLRLRPAGTGPHAFAVVQLVAPAGPRLAQGDTLLASLGRDPSRWLAAVETALARGNLSLASALLFAFEGPSAPDLDALRLRIIRSSCQPAGAAAGESSHQPRATGLQGLERISDPQVVVSSPRASPGSASVELPTPSP